MKCKVFYLPEAEKDLIKLDGSSRLLVRKAIDKVSSNPLPASSGGFGKPLGSKSAGDLTGFLKIKLRASGLRIVYKLIKQDNDMLIVVIGARADDEVYETAEKRAEKYNL